MKKEQFKQSVKAMIANSDFDRLIDKAMNSGCIDVESQDEKDYMTRKALIAAIFEELRNQWKPISKEGKQEFNNICQFL